MDMEPWFYFILILFLFIHLFLHFIMIRFQPPQTAGTFTKINAKIMKNPVLTTQPFHFMIYPRVLAILILVLIRGMNSVAQPSTDGPDDGTIQPLVQVQPQDYVKVRKEFKTKLYKENAAPSRISSISQPPAEVTEIDFYSGDLTLKAWMSRPKAGDKEKHPVVIYLHGGFAFEAEDWNMAKPFRDSGFVVAAPILRGEDGQKGAFSLFYNEVDDVIALAHYLGAQPYVDKTRIYLAGHSAGGTLALLTVQCSHLFSKAASFSGSPDQVIYCKYGFPSKFIPFDTLNIKEFEVRSPLSYAGSFKCPVRLYYGTREPHFHLSTLLTVNEAKKKGLNIGSVQVEGGHEDAVPAEMQLAIKFFNEKR
jgi:hypothetical protein